MWCYKLSGRYNIKVQHLLILFYDTIERVMFETVFSAFIVKFAVFTGLT